MGNISPRALERWFYRKHGMDYGPFSEQEIYDLIREHRIDGQTEIRTVREKRFVRLEEIPYFKAFLDDFLRREAEERIRQEALREAERFEKTVKRHSRLPIFVGVPAILLVSIGVYFAVSHFRGQSGDYELNVFRPIEVASLPPVPKKNNEQNQSDHAQSPAKARKKASRGGAPFGQVERAVENEPIMLDLDMAKEDASGGRVLTEQELRSLQYEVSAAVKQCFELEAERTPDFRGAEVVFYIMTSGEVRVTRVETSEPSASRIRSCAAAAVKRIRVEPFSGGAKVMTIPFHVARLR